MEEEGAVRQGSEDEEIEDSQVLRFYCESLGKNVELNGVVNAC